MSPIIRSVTLLFLLAQQPQPPQTPAEIIDQIGQLFRQLSVALKPATTVTTAAELTEALKVGGPIRMAAGTFVGNFTIAKPTVLTGAGMAATIIEPADRFVHPLQIDGSDVTVQDLTIRNGAPDRDTVIVGRFSATTVEQQPRNVTIERVHVAAGASGGHRGMALHGVNLTVRNSRVTNFWEAGRDSQGIWIHNGPGPYTIEHNYIEASGENILVGGETVRIPGMVPADIVIRGNTCYKPDAWRTNGATVKIGIELKMGRRVLIENNTIDGNWRSGQNGTPIVITTRNQNNDSPWVIIDDVTIRGNVTKRSTEGYAVSILGRDANPSGQTAKILIERNLFTDSPGGFIIGNGVSADLTIRHNTLPAIRTTFLAFHDSQTPPAVKTPLTFTNNVVAQGEYGMNAGDYPYPFDPLVTFTAFTGNVIEKHPARQIKIPPGNTWVEAGALKALLDPLTFKMLNGSAGY
jgi:hypothetical protein